MGHTKTTKLFKYIELEKNSDKVIVLEKEFFFFGEKSSKSFW